MYDAVALAELVDLVRQQLGVEVISMVAESYGTVAATEYAVRYPSHLDRLVLDAPAATSDIAAMELGPTVAVAIDRWQRRCAETACLVGIDATTGDLYSSVLGSLAERPGSAMLEGGPIPVRSRDLEYLALTAQLQPHARSAFLDILVRANAGNLDPLGRAIGELHGLDPVSLQPVFDPSPPTLGGYVAGRCADSAWRHLSSADRRTAYESATRSATPSAEGVLMAEAPCVGFPQAEAVVHADLAAITAPVLIVHSLDDGLTSLSTLASLLSAAGATELVVEGGGHSNLRAQGCVAEVIGRFLLDGPVPGGPEVCVAS